MNESCALNISKDLCKWNCQKHTHAAVDVLPSLSVVSSGAGVETGSMVRYPLPLQEQEEPLGTTHTAVIAGTLQAASTVI